MDDWIFVGFPNEGQIPLTIKSIKHWEPSDIDIVGNNVFFNQGNSRLSMKLEDFKINFKIYLTNL